MRRSLIFLVSSLLLLSILVVIELQRSVATVATTSQDVLVINEVEQNPPGKDAGNEWVELYNPTPASIVLTGWTLSTRHGRTVTIRLSGSMDPYGYRVIGYWKQWLDNEDEQVVLKDSKGRIIDQTPILTDTENDERSWSRYPNGVDTDKPSDWWFKLCTKGETNGDASREEPPRPENTAGQGNLSVHFIDVGQGDAILIVYENWTVMVDSGNRYSSIRDKLDQYLADLSVTHIDLAIATHADSDHIGQLAHLMHSLGVGEVWTNGEPGTSQTWLNLNQTIHNLSIPEHVASRGDTYIMGNVTILVLNPSEPLFGEQNSDSVVVRLTYMNVSFMLTGDADEEAEVRILSIFQPEELRSDVLKLGHHGSRHSTTEPFLDAVLPKVAVISCGYDNPYGHPHNETLQRLIERNITYFRTDIHPELIDDIVATTDGYRLTIIQPSTGQRCSLSDESLICVILPVLVVSYHVDVWCRAPKVRPSRARDTHYAGQALRRGDI